MGGFYYGTEERLVTLKDVPRLLQSLAKVRAVDIKDRSKKDAISKALAIFHLFWFVVHCCARYFLKLPVTLLELFALALAVQSVISYAAWWDKPVNVQYHIRLEEHSSMGTDQDGPHEVTVSLDVDSDTESTAAPSLARSIDNPDNSPGGNSSEPIGHLPLPNTASSKPTTVFDIVWPHNSPAIETSALIDTKSSPGYAEQSLLESIEDSSRKAIHPFTSLYFMAMDFLFADDIGSGVDRRVLTVATGAVGMSSCNGGMVDNSLVPLLVVCVGWLFGALHCVAWSFSFPSHAEKVLWRASSLAIVIFLFFGIRPVFLAGTCKGWLRCLPQWGPIIRLSQWARKVSKRSRIPVFPSRNFPRNSFTSSCSTILAYNHNTVATVTTVARLFSVSFSVLAIVMYIIARVTLFVLALLQFRSLSQPALRTVDWTKFIPHI